jgi:hypothetical protein
MLFMPLARSGKKYSTLKRVLVEPDVYIVHLVGEAAATALPHGCLLCEKMLDIQEGLHESNRA